LTPAWFARCIKHDDTLVSGVAVRVRGVVQGVGFRPFVANLAEDLGIKGQVWNDAEGVMIHAWADANTLKGFEQALVKSPPPLAHIQKIESTALTEVCQSEQFCIIQSESGQTATGVACDAIVCEACLRDIQDTQSRYYQYPFTNCTHCGPRLSIIRQVPYDRGNTSMASFEMCEVCQAAYDNPKNRRFHAQPNACAQCGPVLQVYDNETGEVTTDKPLALAAAWLKEGKIVAIKGIGGVHLACNACDEQAATLLRQRKRRFDKPFALMAKDVVQILDFADVSKEEVASLREVAGPVVVLKAKTYSGIAESVAPRQSSLGFMLPYTPLHHMLMQHLDFPIVLTSGNVSDEPQCIDNEEALVRLQEIADGFVLHNRAIVNRLDDSVAKYMAGQVRVLRRARGFTPGMLTLPAGFEQAHGVLAMGGELKNTFCLLQHGQAIVSQHMGDLENAAVHADYKKNLDLYQNLYDFHPEHIAVDKHPDYFSTQWGINYAAEQGLDLMRVQHHHAHIVACMAEHGVPLGNRVLGIALDGLGMGDSSELWGGEFLVVSYQAAKRAGSIQTAPMLGGAQAMYEPWRNTFAQLNLIGWEDTAAQFSDLGLIKRLSTKPVHNLQMMADKGLNSPLASSMGRLFDAVAASLGICFERASFEGQAAMELEMLAAKAYTHETPAYVVLQNAEGGLTRLVWQRMWIGILRDLDQGVPKEEIAARFHQTLIQSIVKLANKIMGHHGLKDVVLSGGVFQNQLLLEGVQSLLQKKGMTVLIPSDYPMNDGGLSLGQALVAAARQ